MGRRTQRRFQASSVLHKQAITSLNGKFEFSKARTFHPATGKHHRQSLQLNKSLDSDGQQKQLHPEHLQNLREPRKGKLYPEFPRPKNQIQPRNPDFRRSYGFSNPETQTWKPKQQYHFEKSATGRPNVNPVFTNQKRRTEAGSQGNRRVPNVLWTSGLREPKITSVSNRKIFTLFVDNIPHGLARTTVRRMFERCGEVVDLFISAKTRKYTKACFGFVRYGSLAEASKAITELNDFTIQGKNLQVALAKYEKDGSPVSLSSENTNKSEAKARKISNPAFRDSRRYSEVVAGAQKQRSKLELKMAEEEHVIPVTHSLKVSENVQNAGLLQMAIIAENTEVVQLQQIRDDVADSKVNETGLFSLSPTKILITFSCEIDARNAVNMDSPLWEVFDDITMWSEGEFFDDRLVWIDCIGIHPLCYSKENLKKIGELWGPIIHIDSKVQGVERITGARILIRTKSQNKIDHRIKLFYDHGSCDVWVKEHYGSCAQRYDIVEKPTLEHKVNEVNGALQCPYDPLVEDLNERTNSGEDWCWLDPLTLTENIDWINVDSMVSRQNLIVSTPISTNRSSRPRGRPKKNSDCGRTEARKTWDTAQKLGISTDDEEAVLSGLRKSKRIMIMEGKGE